MFICNIQRGVLPTVLDPFLRNLLKTYDGVYTETE